MYCVEYITNKGRRTRIMLAAKNLLDALSRTEDEENSKYENDDKDFGEVLKLYKDTEYNQEVRYSDGKKRKISFD